MCTDLATIMLILDQMSEFLTVIMMSDPLIIIQHNVTDVITAWEFTPNSGLYCMAAQTPA